MTILKGLVALLMLAWGVVVFSLAVVAVFTGAWAPVFLLGVPWLFLVGVTGKVASGAPAPASPSRARREVNYAARTAERATIFTLVRKVLR